MRKSNLKKAAVVALAGLMMAQTALTGCGQKTVDYDVDGNSNQNDGDKTSTSDRAGIGGKLGVPESCNETIDVGNSTLGSITINDEEIEIPNTDKMNVAHFTPYSLTKENKKNIAETLFEKDKGIYLYDYEHRIKSDIQEQIDSDKKQIESAQEEGDTSWVSYLEEEIKELEKELAEAPETYPEAGDYDGEDFFIGTVDDIKYYLRMYNYGEDNEEGTTGMGSYVYFSLDNAVDIRPCEGAVSGDMIEWEDEGSEALGANMSSMTAEEAEDIAENFLADLGITDVIKKQTSDLYWFYYSDNGEDVAREVDGYCVFYSRAIAGTKTYSGYISSADNLQQNNGWADIPVESYSVYVYDGKVVKAYWQQIFGQADSVEENVELLSYEQIIEKANTEMAKYYEKYPTRYKNVEFNDVRLTYYIVSDGDGKCKYIPVWVFSQYEERTDYDGSDNPEQLVILNAMDGSFVDLIEESKALGCYEDY